MNTEYLSIGPTPYGEDCQQVGTEQFNRNKEIIELVTFVKMLKRVHGEPPADTELKIKSFNHDAGTYREVVCEYNPLKKESIDYAFKCEGSAEFWDEQAKQELKEAGYYD